MSEGTAVIYQVGDRVKFELDDCIDYGTVVEVDNSVYTTDGSIWALWDSANMEQYSKPEYLTLIERKQAPKPKFNHEPFKYAAILKHWADGGDIQFKSIGGEKWEDYYSRNISPEIVCNDGYIWRIKPETELITYRTGLTKDNQIKIHTEEPMLDDAYGPNAFKEWLDPEWRTIEVEK